MIFALWNKTWFPLEIMALVICLAADAETVMACGRWWLATHSQQIVGGFSVGVTPSRAKPQDTLRLLSASGELAVTSLLTARSGGHFGADGRFWGEQVVMKWWDTNSDFLPLPFFPRFVPPTFSIPPSAYSHLYLLWCLISLPLIIFMSPLFLFLSVTFFLSTRGLNELSNIFIASTMGENKQYYGKHQWSSTNWY